tara:strand:- start:801 stop:1103 length:303 start_codon:yes stop_codon:yes gene_type:complete
MILVGGIFDVIRPCFDNRLFTEDSIFLDIIILLVSTNSERNDLISSSKMAIFITFLSIEWDDDIITIERIRKRKIYIQLDLDFSSTKKEPLRISNILFFI